MSVAFVEFVPRASGLAERRPGWSSQETAGVDTRLHRWKGKRQIEQRAHQCAMIARGIVEDIRTQTIDRHAADCIIELIQVT